MATDLKAPCQHGRYDEHIISALNPRADCLGGSLLPPDSLVIVKEDGEWPGWALRMFTAKFENGYEDIVFMSSDEAVRVLDALAAAQRRET